MLHDNIKKETAKPVVSLLEVTFLHRVVHSRTFGPYSVKA